MFYVKKNKKRKEERDIKYNEKDTFTSIEVGYGCPTEDTSGG